MPGAIMLSMLPSAFSRAIPLLTRDSESLIAIVDGGHSSRRDSRKAKDRFAVGITELEECTLVGHSEIDVVAVGQPYAGQRITMLLVAQTLAKSESKQFPYTCRRTFFQVTSATLSAGHGSSTPSSA